jgi:hypothetical protein
VSAGRRHLLFAVTHQRFLTLAQAEVGAKTNGTALFRPLLEPLGLDGALVTFDALHSVQANVTWLVEANNAHYIAMIKHNQPTAYRQLAAWPWPDVAVQHTVSSTGHGRQNPAPSRSAASPTSSAKNSCRRLTKPTMPGGLARKPVDCDVTKG